MGAGGGGGRSRIMAAAVIAPSAASRATCTSVPGCSSEECTMLRTPSSASEGSFWTTIELLADRGRRRSAGDADDYPTSLEVPTRRASSIRFTFIAALACAPADNSTYFFKLLNKCVIHL